MKILFLTTAHNSLSQRLFIELTELGHIVDVAVANSDSAMLDVVGRHAPDLIIAPMLKQKIPEAIWSEHVCLIVHPGVKGDHGASSLDWAIMTGQTTWGVTVLQAAAEMDAGAIWASHSFSLFRLFDRQEQSVPSAGHRCRGAWSPGGSEKIPVGTVQARTA
jgi:putative two-component system hydrogenase maturation factor HypX/HoxX